MNPLWSRVNTLWYKQRLAFHLYQEAYNCLWRWRYCGMFHVHCNERLALCCIFEILHYCYTTVSGTIFCCFRCCDDNKWIHSLNMTVVENFLDGCRHSGQLGGIFFGSHTRMHDLWNVWPQLSLTTVFSCEFFSSKQIAQVSPEIFVTRFNRLLMTVITLLFLCLQNWVSIHKQTNITIRINVPNVISIAAQTMSPLVNLAPSAALAIT